VRSLQGEVRLLRHGGALLVQGREGEHRSLDGTARALLGLPVPALPGIRRGEGFSVKRAANVELRRCHWAKSPLMIEYHDREWGKPVHDDCRLFEFLTLEGAQAGLSWETILNKRENYRKAFDDFDAEKIARYDRRKVRKLLTNPGIVRNRLKIASTISNAQAFLAVRDEFGTFDRYIWQFAGERPKKTKTRSSRKIPAFTDESDAMSKDLKRRGFRFVGSTICYAFMQATGMVNDHAHDCFAA